MVQPGNKKASKSTESLSPDDFRNLIYEKGWNFRTLADRWGFTEGYVGKLAKKKDRGKHFDDAVIGLPIVKHHYQD